MKKNISLILLTVITPIGGMAQNPLLIPDTLSGSSINLTIKDSSHQFYSGFNTNTIAFNGSYLGPTLMLTKGQTVTLNVTNQLTETTTTHWHGLHVSSLNDGGPHNTISPSVTWSPSFTVKDHASTYWYHPHLHMKTEEHVMKGAAGLIIIRDSLESSLALPRTYGVDDFPMVVQTQHFNTLKQINLGTAYDSTVIVNGTVKPFLVVPPQVIRVRLLNASNERVYNFGLQGGLTFYQIGGDGGLLQNSVALTRLMLSPGERAEILIDFTALSGQNIYLLSYASEFANGYYGATNPAAMGPGVITGYSSNLLNGNDFNIIQFQVGSTPTTGAITTIPTTLGTDIPISSGTSMAAKTLTITPVVMGPTGMLIGPFQFNGDPFDMMMINYTIPLNNIETWTISNQTAIAHPFHIHDVQFYLLNINGSAPPANMLARKDVVLVPAQQTVTFIAAFDDFCDSLPYMYHCHMLSHEDDGLMGQFVVDCSGIGMNENDIKFSGINLYPNPTQGLMNVTANEPIEKLFVIDNTGRTVYSISPITKEFSIDLTTLKSGYYFINISTRSTVKTFNIVLLNK